MSTHGHPLGLHRVLSPIGGLPQAAHRLNPDLPLWDNEILVDVSLLQIDAASFKSLIDQVQGNQKLSSDELKNRLKQIISHIILERGKMQNPVTHSGGVFFGKIREIGMHHPRKNDFAPGDQVVSLVSLTLTPLSLHEIHDIDLKTDRVFISGHALLFESGMLAKIPHDLPVGVVMAALDVCGAPAQVNRHVQAGETVMIMGLGKAGRSMASAAHQKGAVVFGMDVNAGAVAWCQNNLTGSFEVIKDQNPLTASDWLQKNTGHLVDWVFNATNQDNTEMSSILCAREGGQVMFFGMNTSFQRAVLGVEGIGRDVKLHMGSGYVPGHDTFMLDLLRRNEALMKWFCESFG